MQAAVQMLQKQADEATAQRGAIMAQAEAAAADAAALLRTLRQQLDDARDVSAVEAVRMAQLEQDTKACWNPPVCCPLQPAINKMAGCSTRIQQSMKLMDMAAD